MRAGNELRRRWRSVVVITLLVGVFGTVVFAAAAGARRTSSSLQRFNDSTHSSDVEIDTSEFTPAQLADFRRKVNARAPILRGTGILNVYAMSAPINPNLTLAVPMDDKFGTEIDGSRVLEGRHVDPRAPDEITTGEGLAQVLHLGVGGTIDLETLTPEQLQITFQGNDPGTPAGPPVHLRVVGIERRPLDLGDLAASFGVVLISPGFNHAYGDRIGRYIQVMRADVDDPERNGKFVRETARSIWGKADYYDETDLSVQNQGSKDAMNVLSAALWIFAGVVAIATMVVLGIALLREFSSSRDEQSALRSIGMTRAQRVLSASVRAGLIALGGAVLAVVGAILASPLLPSGLARRADPDVGIHADWRVLGLGALVIVVFVLAIATIGALRAASLHSSIDSKRLRRQPVVDMACEAGVRPTITSGLRMALQPTRGELALPRWSTFLSVAFSVAGITAVLVFSASLAHLVDTPRLYGAPYDFKGPDGTRPDKCAGSDGGVSRDPEVTDVAAVCFGRALIEDRLSNGWAFLPIRGSINPAIVEGRAPTSPNEVALGKETLHSAHKNIGESVMIGEKKSSFTIVGRAAFPRLIAADIQPLADGAMFTPDGFVRAGVDIGASENTDFTRYIVGRFKRGADHAAVLERLGKLKRFHRFGDPSIEFARDAGVVTPQPPPEVDRLRHIGWFAPALAVLLSFLAFIAVAHALFTSVRRRRRDLAMLKTLGFYPNQVRSSIVWQGTTFAVIGLVIGVPMGVLIGKFAWRLVAEGVGISTVATIPPIALAVLIPVAIVLVDVIALIRANAPARARPAVALQAE